MVFGKKAMNGSENRLSRLSWIRDGCRSILLRRV